MFHAGDRHVGKKSHVAMSIDSDQIPASVTRDFESTLVHTYWTCQSISTFWIQQQQEFLSLSVSSGIVLIANIPDKLAEHHRRKRVALKIFHYPEIHYDSREICKLRMRFNTDTNYLPPHDDSGLP